MANRTMEELLQAPTDGYGEVIVILEILAENFEIKTNLLQLVQANKFHDRENDNPHTHISNFKRMTATLKYRDVPNDAIKLMLFLYSLEDKARIWGNNFQNNQGYHAQMNNALNFQNQGFQNQPFSIPNNQIPPNVPNELSSYIKSNEIAIKSMQNQINILRGDFNKQEENLRRNLKDDMSSILGSFFQNQPSTSGTLLSNTVPNPKGEMKALTTRSGLAYEGPSIPTESSLEKVNEQNTEEILDKEHSNISGSTAQVQPSVVPISILKPDVLRTQKKPTIPYPSSFADALLLMPKFASTIKSLLANKDKLFELAKVPLNENCSVMLLKKLPEKLGDPELTLTRMTLELADRSITRPKGVAEDVFVKVGKFHFLTDFVVVDFEADPRVPLILGRSFLRTGRALIDVYGEEITLRVNDESVTFNLDQVIRYSNNSVSRVNVINIASEELVQDKPKSSNHTLVSESDFYEDPIVKTSPFGERDILLIEKLLNEDLCQLPPMNLNQAKSPMEEPEYSLSMGYEHFITTPVTELDEVAESSAKNLVPIQSEYEVTSDNEKIDIVTNTDELLPTGFENDDLEGEIDVIEELHVDNSIPNSENKLSDNEASDFNDPSFLRPPPKLPDVEFDFEPNSGRMISVMMNNIDEFNNDECFDPGGEIDVFANIEDDDTFPSCLSFEFFYHISSIPRCFLYFSPPGVKTPFLTMVSPFRVGDISSGWNFHFLSCLSKF
nr:hypothetical protein [Tanacetum cinerariifolium]